MAHKAASSPQSAYEKALHFHQRGRLAEARVLCERALELQPCHFSALQLLGIIDLQSNQPARAAEAFGKAILLEPASATAHHNQGNANHLLMRYQAAVECYTEAIARDRNCVDSYYNRGNSLLELKQFEAAIASYDEALTRNPNHAEAWFNRGNGFIALGRFAPAIASFERALVLRPAHAEAYNNRGIALFGLRQFEAAVASFDEAIALTPTHAAAHGNRGNALVELKRYEAAIASFDVAIRLNPSHTEAYNSRGNALRALERYQDAVASFDAAISLKPAFAGAYYNRGNSLRKLNQPGAAVASYDTAISLDPTHADAHNNRGVALRDLRRYQDAVSSFDAAVARQPDHTDAHYNRGNALRDLQQHAAAVLSYDQAISLDAGYADAHVGRAEALKELGQYAASIASFDTASALKPNYAGLFGQCLQARMLIGDWTDLENKVARLIEGIERDEAASSPYPVLALLGSARLQRRAAETWVREQCPPDASLGAFPSWTPHERIRIGYFSADFRNHPVSILAAELFETHDRSRFEITAFAFGPPSEGAMRKRLERAFERFLDVRDRSDLQIAQLARELQIDIAVDLSGFTQHCRPGIFALRAAPLQVGFLGYPGTMGAPYIDYLLADPTLIPQQCRVHYREQILYLPHSVMPHDSQQPIAQAGVTRRQAGLPDSGFVFCGFNNVAKITPDTFARWMRILSAVPGSVLWLSATHPSAQSNLRREAQMRGVEPQRLIFAERLASLPDHLARQRLADLFLDTLPYNAHTTASDALWAGLPVLTLLGETFAGRVAASLLTAIDIPELITSTPEQYEALAISLAANPAALAHLRDRLARNRLTTPLFDTQRHTQHLEEAFMQIHARYQARLPPAHILVQR
jgi:predicted O-linked N-acetylglucosamine transferase (SPINDLY family)